MSAEFPRWVYNHEGGVIVQNQSSLDALDGDWYFSPADVPAPNEEAAFRTSLSLQAQTKGIAIDGRWSSRRIQSEIDKVG